MPVTLAIILLISMFMPNGSGSSAQPFVRGNETMTESFEITYRARGSRPSVDLDLHVGADGQTEVFVGSSTSIPLARVSRIGTFAGKAPTAELEAIRAYLNEHKLADRAGNYGAVAPSTPNRYLELTVDGRQAQFKIGEGANDPEIEGSSAYSTSWPDHDGPTDSRG